MSSGQAIYFLKAKEILLGSAHFLSQGYMVQVARNSPWLLAF